MDLALYSTMFQQGNSSLLPCAFSLKATYLLPQHLEGCLCSLLIFPLRVCSVSAGRVPSALWTNWQDERIFQFGRERACSPGKALQGNCFLRNSSPHLWQPSPETKPLCCSEELETHRRENRSSGQACRETSETSDLSKGGRGGGKASAGTGR